MKPSSYATIATQYARAVVAGKIPTCKWVKQACQRQLDDLAKFKGVLYADEAIDPFALDIHTYSWVQTKFRSRGISGRCLLEPALEDYNGQPLIVLGAHDDITCDPEYLMINMIEPFANYKGTILLGISQWVQYEAAEQTSVI